MNQKIVNSKINLINALETARKLGKILIYYSVITKVALPSRSSRSSRTIPLCSGG